MKLKKKFKMSQKNTERTVSRLWVKCLSQCEKVPSKFIKSTAFDLLYGRYDLLYGHMNVHLVLKNNLAPSS